MSEYISLTVYIINIKVVSPDSQQIIIPIETLNGRVIVDLIEYIDDMTTQIPVVKYLNHPLLGSGSHQIGSMDIPVHTVDVRFKHILQSVDYPVLVSQSQVPSDQTSILPH